jgi:hypothetical protein
MSAEVSERQPHSLMSMAEFWGDSSSQIAYWATEISSSTWLRDAGIFWSVIEPYNQVCEKIGRLCTQGTEQMEVISQCPFTGIGAVTEHVSWPSERGQLSWWSRVAVSEQIHSSAMSPSAMR